MLLLVADAEFVHVVEGHEHILEQPVHPARICKTWSNQDHDSLSNHTGSTSTAYHASIFSPLRHNNSMIVSAGLPFTASW